MTSRMTWGACALVLLSFGCSGPRFDHLQYRNVSNAPGTVDLRPRDIRIEKGLAVRASVSALDDSGDYLDVHGLTSGDSKVFRVDPGPSAGDYVFSAVEVGKTELDVDTEVGLTALPVEVVQAN